jgi:hypothetical protein
MVRLNGYGKEDDRTVGLCRSSDADLKDRGRQGFLLSEAQRNDLIDGIELPRLSEFSETRFWAQLNFVRERVLKDCLRHDQQPSRAQVHKGMAELLRLIRDFHQRLAPIGALPNWSTDTICIASEGLAGVFYGLPEQLYQFASHARHEGKTRQHADYLALAEAADRLAQHFKYLDFEAKDKIFDALPRTSDYRVRSLTDAIHIVQTLEITVADVLEQSKKIGGPPPKTAMRHVVVLLGDLIEACGGKFTHTPRLKGHYDGRPHTPAAQFVFKFLKMCDSRIIETAVSQLMANAIEYRNERDRQAPPARETSS